MNKYQTYFGQIITDDELNEIFDSFATAIEQFVQDFNYVGIAVGGEVTQNASPNMTVLANGPAVVYDQFANRMSWGAPVVVNCALDENNQPTAVVGSSNEKYLSIFAKFVSTPSDPREDELGNTVYFRHVGSYQLRVVQGSEAPVGTAPRPALRGDQVLLADVRLIANQTAILTADVSTSRTQVIFDLAGTPIAIKEKSLKPVTQALLNAINSFSTDTLIVPAIPGSPISTPTASVHAVFIALLTALNNLINQVNGMPQNLGGVAFLAATQTFTGSNTFGGITLGDQLNFTTADPQRPLVATAEVPSGARWKKIFEFKHGGTAAGGQYIRMYTGNDGTTSGNGAFAITSNCDWNGSVWQRRDQALSALALIWTYNRLRVCHKYAGTDTWANWDAPLPGAVSTDHNGVHLGENLVVNGWVHVVGNLESNDLKARANFDVDGSSDLQAVKISGELTTGDGTLHMPSANIDCINIDCNDITADDFTGDKVNGSEFLYVSTAKFRNFEISIVGSSADTNTANWQPCWVYRAGAWQAAWWDYDNQGSPGITPPGGGRRCVLDIPLNLPHQAVLKSIDILHYNPTTDMTDFRVYKQRTSWSSVAAPPGWPASDTDGVDWWGGDPPPTTAGWHKSTMTLAGGAGITLGKSDGEYVLRIFAGKTGAPVNDLGTLGASNGAVIARVRATWDDPGPRNY